MYSSLEYTQRLEATGFTRHQAEEVVTTMSEAMDKNFATKSDLNSGLTELRHEFKRDILLVQADIRELRVEIKAIQNAIVVRLTGVMLVGLPISLKLFSYVSKWLI